MIKTALTLALVAASLVFTAAGQGGSCRSGGATVGEEKAGRQRRLAEGLWGGKHIRLEVTGEGASAEFDCATGTLEGPLTLDGDGRFEVKGTFTPERGGPVREGREPEPRPARYSGRVKAEVLTLTVTLTDDADDVETFTLTHGREALLTKCR